MTLTAELARTLLDCPTRVRLMVDDGLHALGGEVGLELQDDGGTMTLVCVVAGRGAVVSDGRVEVQVAGAAQDGTLLTVAGALRWVRRESCDCCGEIRSLVAVELEEVRLVRGAEAVLIAPDAFVDPALGLNAGFLRRTADHINLSHAPELCEAIALRTDGAVESIVAAQLVDLTAGGVELQWVTVHGAERVRLGFARPARTRDEFGLQLRSALDLHC